MEEFTFLLPRPQWQPDEVSRYCKRCHVNFSLFNRKHHCRHCGLIYCNTCCSRKTSLRQLGYQDPVKVCEDCFEVAYLISYVLQLESKSTQLHGARGLLGLLANKDESQIKMFIQNGLLDAFIFLSQKSLSPELHLLSTIALRFLIENVFEIFFTIECV
ncbi:FYVE-domain-containing protein [Neoconidiobolus thromboides FSU 785]|nr:FYVE-domain-containing protein [Neoconidiobolus thromboides FSU 785]